MKVRSKPIHVAVAVMGIVSGAIVLGIAGAVLQALLCGC